MNISEQLKEISQEACRWAAAAKLSSATDSEFVLAAIDCRGDLLEEILALCPIDRSRFIDLLQKRRPSHDFSSDRLPPIDPAVRAVLSRTPRRIGRPLEADAAIRALLKRPSSALKKLLKQASPRGELIEATWLDSQDFWFPPHSTLPGPTAERIDNGPFGNDRLANAEDLKPYLRDPEDDEHLPFRGLTVIVNNARTSNSSEEARRGPVAICNTTLHVPLGSQSPNALVVGSSGSGKSQGFTLPAFDAAVRRGFSCVILNCKGKKMTRVLQEITRVHGRKPTLLALKDPTRSVGWNPIKELDNLGDANEMAQCLAQSARDEQASSSDGGRWFDNQAKEWVGSAIHAVANGNAPSDQHLPYLRGVVLGGDYNAFAKLHPTYPVLAKFERYERSGNMNAQTIAATISEHLLFADDEAVAAVLANDELRLGRFAKEGGVLIVEIDEADIDVLRPLTTLFLRRLFSALLKEAAASPTGKLANRYFIFVDELAAAGRIPSLNVVLNTFRERGISMVAGTQSLSQLQDIYGPAANSILAGYQTQIALPGGLDAISAEYFSRRSGTMTAKNLTVNEDFDDAIGTGRPVGRSWSPVSRPVLLPSEIARPERHPLLGMPATVLLGTGTPLFYAYFPRAFEIGHLARAIERAEAANGDDLRPEPLKYRPNPDANELTSHGVVQITNASGWSAERIRERYEALKPKIGWTNTTGAAFSWWTTVEGKNPPAALLRVAEELLKRKASITELYQVYIQISHNCAEVNLRYLDYVRAKEAAAATERAQAARDAGARQAQGIYQSGDCPSTTGWFEATRPIDTTKQLKGIERQIRISAGHPFPQLEGFDVCWERMAEPPPRKFGDGPGPKEIPVDDPRPFQLYVCPQCNLSLSGVYAEIRCSNCALKPPTP